MYDVFISFSTKNEDEAKRIHKILEDNGLSCWLAPFNIRGHHDFTADIPRAIRNSKVYLLLMSEDAQRSKWVPRELVTADDLDLPIFTLFIEDCTLQDRFKFILHNNQYYGYSDDRESQISRLIGEIKDYLLNGDDDIDDPDNNSTPVERPVIKKKSSKKKLLIIAAACLLAVILVIAGFAVFGGSKKIKGYVIWAPAYNIALTGDTVNSHYLAGETIGVSDSLPSSYSEKCVWQVTFNDDGTFTVSRDGMTLGVEPGYNGIGLGGDYTSDLWKIVDAEGDVCYIQNVDSGDCLEWYADKENWATHGNITDENRGMFRLRMDPVR